MALLQRLLEPLMQTTATTATGPGSHPVRGQLFPYESIRTGYDRALLSGHVRDGTIALLKDG